MTHREYIEEERFFSGLWYYHIRAFPLEALADDYGVQVAELLRRLELIARLGWKNPAMQWDAEQIRKRLIAFGLSKIIKVYRGKYGMPVLIPITSFFYRAFASYPNLNTVYGERGSGKTIFAWVTAYLTYLANRDRYEEFQIYVYGDVDGLTKELQKTAPDAGFRKALIFMEDYDAPEAEEHIGKFILYNELDDTLMSENALGKEQREIKKMIFRSRHYMYWMFYNVIRYNSIMKTVRISSSFQSFKPLSQKLMEEVVENAFTRPYRSVVLQALGDLDFTQAITSIPLYRSDWMGLRRMGSKQAITITPIFAPRWLLEAASRAKKDYKVGSEAMKEKEEKMIEIAAEKYLEGMSVNKIVSWMEIKHNFKRSYKWWYKRLVSYFIKNGYQFNDLKEVRDNAEVRRIREEVFG